MATPGSQTSAATPGQTPLFAEGARWVAWWMGCCGVCFFLSSPALRRRLVGVLGALQDPSCWRVGSLSEHKCCLCATCSRDSASPRSCPGRHHGHCALPSVGAECSQDLESQQCCPLLLLYVSRGVEMGPGASNFVAEQPEAEAGQLGQSWGRLPIMGR